MYNRFTNAIAIVGGACNPSGIALAIAEACSEIRNTPGHTGTQQICDDPAVRLMVGQLSFIVGNGEMDFDAYTRCRDACTTGSQTVAPSAIEDGGDK